MNKVKNFPLSGTALDFIKIAAAVLMLIDHIDHQLLERSAGFLYLVGRGAYPLFAFAAASALVRGGMEKAPHYAVRLLILAVLIVPVLRYSRDVEAANILFTLAIGMGIAPFVIAQGRLVKYTLFGAGLLTILMPNIFEFGFAGALLPVLFYLYIKKEVGGWWLWPMLAAANFGGICSLMDSFEPMMLTGMIAVALATIVIPMGIIYLGGFLPNDRKRLMPKYFLHVFYPAHIFILAVIAKFL
mgnify:CR=1 FL=1